MGLLLIGILTVVMFAVFRRRTSQPIIPEEFIIAYSRLCKYSKLILALTFIVLILVTTGSGFFPSSGYRLSVLIFDLDMLWGGITLAIAIAILQPNNEYY